MAVLCRSSFVFSRHLQRQKRILRFGGWGVNKFCRIGLEFGVVAAVFGNTLISEL